MIKLRLNAVLTITTTDTRSQEFNRDEREGRAEHGNGSVGGRQKV